VKIGELAKRSGVSIDAVRYYERRGVLPPAERTPSGYRVFDEESVVRLDLVRQLQDLGFTLDEVVDALLAHDRGDATCASERWRLELVGDRIDRKVGELQRTRRMIRATLAACDDGRCRLSSVAAQPGSDQGTG
jgi:DNA-binding transcriptional MerR regulator